MERSLNCHGKSALSVHRPIQKLSSLKKVDLLVRQRESVSPAMLDLNVWNMPWPMTRDLEFGAGFQSESDADLNVAQHKKFQALPVENALRALLRENLSKNLTKNRIKSTIKKLVKSSGR
jgi:hypothetical protein